LFTLATLTSQVNRGAGTQNLSTGLIKCPTVLNTQNTKLCGLFPQDPRSRTFSTFRAAVKIVWQEMNLLLGPGRDTRNRKLAVIVAAIIILFTR